MKKLTTVILASMLSSCGHFYTKSDTYKIDNTQVKVNGANLSTSLKPMGGNVGMQFSAMIYMAGGASLKGPFLWRIEAEGIEGVHQSLIVHRLKVETTKTKRSEWYPTKYLGVAAPFKKVPKEEGKSFAQYQIPGKLEVYPKKDGQITVLVDVSVKAEAKTERKMIRFKMVPSTEKDVDFVFVPAEIVTSLRGNPKEWKY